MSDKTNKILSSRLKILEEKKFLDNEYISISNLINKTKDRMVEQEVNKQAELAYFYFLTTFIFVLSSFIVLWYLATKFTSLSIYFNDIFCRSRKYKTDKRDDY